MRKLSFWKRILCIGLLLSVVAVALVAYARTAALRIEQKYMPDLSALRAPHVRKESFHPFEPWGPIVPHWKITYYDEPSLGPNYQKPSISVDIFGRVVEAGSKEVGFALQEDGHLGF